MVAEQSHAEGALEDAVWQWLPFPLVPGDGRRATADETQGMITLPDDLTDFLAAKRQLEYAARECECGQVILVPLGKHELGEVWVDGQSLRDVAPDPNKGVEGYYAVPAINLVESCDGYDPEHILSWIPDSDLYISWDCDHWAITMFPSVTWRQIANSPLQYINAQWESRSIGQPLIPWPKFPFRKGRPF